MVHWGMNNKKLAISLVLNIFLACVLWTLLYFVYPQFIYELSSVSDWDRYSVRTYRNCSKGIDVIDGLLDARFQDLNGDGVAELTGADGAYACFLGDSYAGSPRPSVVLSFDKARQRFVLNKSLMSKSPLPPGRLDELGVKYKNDTRWHAASRPPTELFDTMLELIYGGNEKQAWELFEASWPEGATISKERYRDDIEGELSRSPFHALVVGRTTSTTTHGFPDAVKRPRRGRISYRFGRIRGGRGPSRSDRECPFRQPRA